MPLWVLPVKIGELKFYTVNLLIIIISFNWKSNKIKWLFNLWFYKLFFLKIWIYWIKINNQKLKLANDCFGINLKIILNTMTTLLHFVGKFKDLIKKIISRKYFPVKLINRIILALTFSKTFFDIYNFYDLDLSNITFLFFFSGTV